MHVRFWGTRGSIATPGPRTAKYGGNTSCVEVRADEETLIILDCGTGVRELGLSLLESGPRPLRVHLFVGHMHWDHIQGFPFFVPAFLPDTELNVYAPTGFQRSLEETLAGQMQYSYFPVKLQDLRSRLRFTELEEGFFRVGNVLVETQYLNHTAPTIAYRISGGGATVAYVTDHEPFCQLGSLGFRHPGDQNHVSFLRGTDLIIHDAQYSEEEYPSKIGWGHSTIQYATDVAIAAGARYLALFHHDPAHDDATLKRLEEEARAQVAARSASLEIFAAAEGLDLKVQGSGKAAAVAETSALWRRPIAGGHVMVVSADEKEIATIRQELAEDGLVVTSAPDRRTALAQAPEVSPDVVIINRQLQDSDGAALIQPLRSRLKQRNVPILFLTDNREAEPDLPITGTAVVDCMFTPFSPPMLRTRVRAWLVRSLMARDTEAAGLSRRGGRRGQARGGPRTIAAAARGEPASASGYATILASLPLFRSLNREQLHNLLKGATERVYQDGQVVIRQGQVADKVFVVLSGRVRVVERASDVAQLEMFLGELGHGEIFGEMGVINDELRTATVVALEPTRCLALPHTNFLRVLESSRDLSTTLLRVMTTRLNNADRLLARYAPDPLTGLATRRAFHDHYRRLAAEARRRHCPITLLCLDTLQLKSLNDRFGYSVGDEVLRGVAEGLIDVTHTTDLVSRLGGDEFAALLLDAGPKEVDLVVGRVQEKLSEMASRCGIPQGVQLSVGVAVSQVPPEGPEEMLREADHDMQRKKTEQPGSLRRPTGKVTHRRARRRRK